MKRTLLSLLFIISLSFAARAQYVAIPDSNFGNWLNAHGYASCLTGNAAAGWMMDTTCGPVIHDTAINCYAMGIKDLTGIQYFRNLDSLDCSNNQLRSLPAWPASLSYLNCSGNPLYTLSGLPSSIITVICSQDSLTSVSALPNSLTYFYCDDNQLQSLPALPPYLSRFICYNNYLDSLPMLPADLQYLDCHNNNLTGLPALPSHFLSDVYCNGNLLTSLPPLDSLFALLHFQCDFNRLTNLPALPPYLTSLGCAHNHLTSLPALPPRLESLYCCYNQLTSLPAFPSAGRFTQIYCNNNPSLTCFPSVHFSFPFSYFYAFYIDSTGIICLPNAFSSNSFDINPGTMPLCGPGSGCELNYNIAGRVHLDTAANCSADSLASGPGLRSVKVMLKKNGQVVQQCYTVSSGQYSFKTDSLRSYEVSIDSTRVPLQVACPGSGVRTVALSAIDTLEPHQDFAVQCPANGYVDVDYIAGWFRPGWHSMLYNGIGNVAYMQNGLQCASGDTGSLTTIIHGPVHYWAPAAFALTPAYVSASGDTIVYPVVNFDTLNEGSFYFWVSTDSSANSASTICVTDSLSPSGRIYTQCFGLTNSWDPNHKEVYPAGNIDTGSQWLTYTVRFQNTGNGIAYNIVVKDTLSQYLDASSFQYIASSHHAEIQLTGNAMTFTFAQINLPDSNADFAGSEGWIQYKVRTNAHIPNGSQIANTASIYFDLNPAVVTNTVISQVQTCVTVYDSFYAVTCVGTPYIFGGSGRTASGYYNDTLQTISGCDSILTLHLTVNQVGHDTISRRICAGSSYLFYGNICTQAGYYNTAISTQAGCDSFIILHLLVDSIPIVNAGRWHNRACLRLRPADIVLGDTIAARGASGHYLYSWYPTDSLDNPSIANPTLHSSYTMYNYYYLLVTDSVTGCRSLDSTRVVIDSPSTLIATASPSHIRPGQTSYLSVSHGAGGGHGYDCGEIIWWNGDMQPDERVAPTTTTTYSVGIGGCVCSESATVTVYVNPYGINEVNNADIRLYPNPNSGTFTLETTRQQGNQYTIYDVLGQIVQERIITADTQHIDMAEAADGIYTVMIKGANGSVRFTVLR